MPVLVDDAAFVEQRAKLAPPASVAEDDVAGVGRVGNDAAHGRPVEPLAEHRGNAAAVQFAGHRAEGHAVANGLEHEPDRLAGLILAGTAAAIDYIDVLMAGAQKRGKPEELAAFTKVGRKYDILGKTKQQIIDRFGL